MRLSEMIAHEKRRSARGHVPAPRSGAEVWVLVGLVILAMLLSACATPQYRDTEIEMTTNGPVDLARYAGRWYEIARFPNRFEEGFVGVTAEYTLNDDGSVTVVNTCRQGALDGPIETAEGRAVAASPDNDKLRVSFVSWLPFAAGDYWILDTDYEVAVIGTPSGSVGWVLARMPSLPPQRLAQAFLVLQRNGYALERITMTPQRES